jgi:hypothetical protein
MGIPTEMIVFLLILILLCLLGGPILVFNVLDLSIGAFISALKWLVIPLGSMALVAFWLLLEATAPKQKQ